MLLTSRLASDWCCLGYVDREFGHAGRIYFPMLVRTRDEIISRAKPLLGRWTSSVRPRPAARSPRNSDAFPL